MKKDLKSLALFAMSLTVGLSSCSSDDEVSVDPNQKEQTRFSISISNPATYAEDANATTEEVAFNAVDVFIYKKGGAYESHVFLDKEDFVKESGSNIWKIKDASRILSTIGDKEIYVGLNLPSSVVAQVKATGLLAVNTIAAVNELKASANGFAMFSKSVKEYSLKKEEGSHKNEVTVAVSRLLAKVAFYADKTEFDVLGVGGKARNLQFTTGNVNNKFYAIQPLDFSDPNFAPLDESATFLHPGSGVDAYQGVNPTVTAIKAANVVYATENTVKGIALQGSVTYGIVQVVYTPAVVVDADGENPTTPTAGASFWLLKTLNKGNLFFSTKADAEAYATSKSVSLDNIIEYTNGKMYYSVWLKDTEKGDANKFSVHRNTIYKVSVTGITGLGSNTDQPGTPGNPGVIIPEKPIDPEEGDPTDISVNVEIEDWTMALEQDETLEGK